MDTAQTHRWLAGLFLTPDDPVTWQVFADRPDVPVRPYWVHAPLADVAARLERDNRAGAGVFAMINAGDGRGRRNKSVQTIRAHFVDSDSGDLPDSLHAPPSMVTQSANGQHGYWAVSDGDRERFSTIQRQLAAHYRTDPAINDLARVMRVAGFDHHKDPDRPYPVTVARLTSWGMYTTAALTAGLPAAAVVARRALSRSPLRLPHRDDDEHRADFATLDVVALFTDAGMYGRALGDGKHAIDCPWLASHTQQRPAAHTDSIVYSATGGAWPQFDCKHASCDGTTIVDVLRHFGFTTVARYCTGDLP